MGFFDRFTARKGAPEPVPAREAQQPATPGTAPGLGVKARLVAGREKLELKDLPGALAIYEEVLATAGDRADVLVTISGDLGTHGHVAEIIEFIAPRYDAERHGPATGLNLLQAYLALRNPDAAQHVLDILFSLNRPELEDRLHGFSNAIAELMAAPAAPTPDAAATAGVPKVGLITISKPVWFYGLEPLAGQILPPKEGRLRRVAFAQLAIPGIDVTAVVAATETELTRLTRAVPVWLAETFYFSANYAPVAAIGIITPPDGGASRPMVFGAEWSTDNLRQLVDSSAGGLDYVFTGAVREVSGDYELVLRLYEVKGFRERKKFAIRWTPATADAEFGRLHAEIRRFMEWSPLSAGIPYAPPAAPRAWLDTLGASTGLFLIEKSILAADQLMPPAPELAKAAGQAASGEAASLAYLTLRDRAAKLGVAAPDAVSLASSPAVDQARQLLTNG